jgi:Tfp pilus assembly protein PilE
MTSILAVTLTAILAPITLGAYVAFVRESLRAGRES